MSVGVCTCMCAPCDELVTCLSEELQPFFLATLHITIVRPLWYAMFKDPFRIYTQVCLSEFRLFYVSIPPLLTGLEAEAVKAG